MTPEQLTLARRWCELVGWEIKDGSVCPMIWVNRRWTEASWLLTGDGMLAVKAECAKRGFVIASGNGVRPEPYGIARNWELGDDCEHRFSAATEPEAVLRAAVAAMEAEQK